MKYIILHCRLEEAEKKLNDLTAQGWKIVAQSESTCQYSTTITFTLVKEN